MDFITIKHTWIDNQERDDIILKYKLLHVFLASSVVLIKFKNLTCVLIQILYMIPTNTNL